MIFLYILSSHFALTTFVQTSWQTHRKLRSRASIQCVSCDAAEMRTASSTYGSLHLCSDTTKRYPNLKWSPSPSTLRLFPPPHSPLSNCGYICTPPHCDHWPCYPARVDGGALWFKARATLLLPSRFLSALLREVRKIFGQFISTDLKKSSPPRSNTLLGRGIILVRLPS